MPVEAIESFAGLGHHLGLADLRAGDRVVDLGSGSGMDAFLAARRVGDTGHVVGVDMTAAQLEKARRLAERGQQNPEYALISDSAQGATGTFGVKSTSILATKLR